MKTMYDKPSHPTIIQKRLIRSLPFLYIATCKQSSIFVPIPDNGGTSSLLPKDRARKRLAVIGAAAVDIVSHPSQGVLGLDEAGYSSGLVAKTTVPGATAIRLGGVARNVHEAAFKCGATDAVLIAPIGRGNDPLAKILRDGLSQLGASQEGLVEMDGQTPSVNMILDKSGTLEVGVAATQLVEQMSWNQVSECTVVSIGRVTQHASVD